MLLNDARHCLIARLIPVLYFFHRYFIKRFHCWRCLHFMVQLVFTQLHFKSTFNLNVHLLYCFLNSFYWEFYTIKRCSFVSFPIFQKRRCIRHYLHVLYAKFSALLRKRRPIALKSIVNVSMFLGWHQNQPNIKQYFISLLKDIIFISCTWINDLKNNL